MCGLVGSYTGLKENQLSFDLLVKMRDSMTHRGPDGSGTWVSPERNCMLVHRRLAILDLSAEAAQPMSKPDNSIAIVFNGEIYNHRELRQQLSEQFQIHWRTDHSDTEMILHAYDKWGLDAIKTFYGMFSLAIFDRRDPQNPKLHLVRDRIFTFAYSKSVDT